MSDERESTCPNCKEVQCAQAHECLNAILDMLGVGYEKHVYVIGKTISIAQAVGDLKVHIARLNREVFEQRAIAEAYKGVIDRGLDTVEELGGKLRNANLDDSIKYLVKSLTQNQ